MLVNQLCIKFFYLFGSLGFGNVEPAPTAEWNFFNDPESAFAVLSSIPKKTYIATWETSLDNNIPFVSVFFFQI